MMICEQTVQISQQAQELLKDQRKKLIQNFMDTVEALGEVIGYAKIGEDSKIITNALNKFCLQANNSNLMISALLDESEEESPQTEAFLKEDLNKLCLEFSEEFFKLNSVIPEALKSHFAFYYDTLRKPQEFKYRKTELKISNKKCLTNLSDINLELITEKINKFLYAYSNSNLNSVPINENEKGKIISNKIEEIKNGKNWIPENDIDGIIAENKSFFHRLKDQEVINNLIKIEAWLQKDCLSDMSRTKLIQNCEYLIHGYHRYKLTSYEARCKKTLNELNSRFK